MSSIVFHYSNFKVKLLDSIKFKNEKSISPLSSISSLAFYGNTHQRSCHQQLLRLYVLQHQLLSLQCRLLHNRFRVHLYGL